MTSKLTQPVVPRYKGSLEEDRVLVEGEGVPVCPVAVVEVAALLQHGAAGAPPAGVAAHHHRLYGRQVHAAEIRHEPRRRLLHSTTCLLVLLVSEIM